MVDRRLSRESMLSTHDQNKIKRRDLRKGTHSCWECKRRKMRCVFDANARENTCQGCRRRGTACVGQEIPEEVAFRIINSHETGDSVEGAVESPINILHGGESTVPSSTNRIANGPITPASTVPGLLQASDTVPSLERDDSFVPTSEQGLGTISQQLYAALPSIEDTQRIYKARPVSDVSIYDLMTMPYTILSQTDLATVTSQVEDVNPQWHPVLIARHMLMLASSLLHLDPDVHSKIGDLSEEPQVISRRMVRLANHFVVSKDEMVGSVEQLECVLIESVYQANLGNLRRSWMTARRALSIAQLMGLDHSNRHGQYQVLDTKRLHDPRVMWHRIVFLDHFLCVMLSLPAACSNSGWSLDAGPSLDDPKGRRLERIHCMVASRILEASGKDLVLDRHKLQELDSELQRAARSLPTKWWLVPRLDASQADPRMVFWNTGRVFAQVLHYNLVYRLHLPYVFRSSPTDHAYDYSRITCVSASREILTRFLALRTFNSIASSCRIIDFIALMASLTLLLSHLHAQAFATENLLAHQYHSDRAVIEQVQETMEKSDQLKSDPLSARSADLLGRLMAIDIYEDGGFLRPANSVSVHPEAGGAGNNDENSVSVHIPYFGLIRISRDSNLNLSFRHAELRPSSLTRPSLPVSESAMDVEALSNPPVASTSGTSDHHNLETLPRTSTALTDLVASTAMPTLQSSSDILPDHAHDIYPGLAADMEDWTFQGVDLAFFDTIMQSIESNEGELESGLSQPAPGQRFHDIRSPIR